MALEILLGASVGELLKIVSNARERIASFQPTLKKLEKTLRAIDRRLVEIDRLNDELDISSQEMEDLVAVVENGKVLVRRCSEVSTFNFVKQMKYSKQLVDLDDDLLRYFMTTLSLDHFKNTKTILAKVNQMQTLIGEISVGRISHISSQSTENPKEDWRIVYEEAKKLYTYSKKKDESFVMLGGASGKAEVARLSIDSIKEEAPVKLMSKDSRNEETELLSKDFKKEEASVIKLPPEDSSKDEEAVTLSAYPKKTRSQNLEEGVMKVKLVGGEMVELAVGHDLFKAVVHAKKNYSYFQELVRIESYIIAMVDTDIWSTRLSDVQKETEDLAILVRYGEKLALGCSKISFFNSSEIGRHTKKLIGFRNSLMDIMSRFLSQEEYGKFIYVELDIYLDILLD